MAIEEERVMNRWYNQDWTEELVVIVLAVVAILIVWSWKGIDATPGSEIASAIVGGLVGYLTRRGKKKDEDIQEQQRDVP